MAIRVFRDEGLRSFHSTFSFTVRENPWIVKTGLERGLLASFSEDVITMQDYTKV